MQILLLDSNICCSNILRVHQVFYPQTKKICIYAMITKARFVDFLHVRSLYFFLFFFLYKNISQYLRFEFLQQKYNGITIKKMFHS